MDNISGSIDLLKLAGAKVVNGKNGVPHIVIPIEEAKLHVYAKDGGDQKIFLNLTLRYKENDQYGNDFMISRSNTKEETEHNKTASKEEKEYGEILGNAKFFASPQTSSAPVATSTFEPEEDDLPF